MTKTLICNLFAGPGAGKSTTAAAVFAEMKYRENYSCELLTEIAKDRFWEGTLNTVDDQVYIFARQLYELRCMMGKMDVVVTDAPLLTSLVYQVTPSLAFEAFVREIVEQHNNLNVFLRRTKVYSNVGRSQNEMAAIELDLEIRTLLDDLNVPVEVLQANRGTPSIIVSMIERRLQG